MNAQQRLIIIDGHSLMHRAFHALPPLTTRKGELVNAVYGFLLALFRAIKEFSPNYIAVTFDLPFPTFRHQKFAGYKATRPKAPEEFYSQIPRVKGLLKIFNIPFFEKEGYEADDVIGTISHLAKRAQILPKIETIILSGDLDTLQLINSQTKVCFLRKGVKELILYDGKATEDRYGGLSPSQLPDYKALKGDPTDNILGVPGVGEKTAIFLIRAFGSIENLYQELEKKSEEANKLKIKLRETLIKNKEQAFLSKELALIEKNVPLEFRMEDCRWGDYSKTEAENKLKDLEFYSLINKLPSL